MANDVIPVQRKITTLDVSPQFDSYSKVIIHVDDDTAYEYGTETGRTLEFDNPFGSLQMCQDVLARLQGYQYQPYQADGTILDPAAEIGDALNSPLIYGGIYTRSKTFGRLMKADVSAPHDEEINHEYQYESPEQREFKRETSDLRASLVITNNAITAEVIRATEAEGTLTSQITQQATQIAAKVSQSGGDSSSFGWTLTASGFSLYSGGTEVMKCDSTGLTVKGNIAGSTGTIGGFTISSSALYTNNMSSISSTQSTGVHLSASGIKLGQNFTVDSAGNLTCTNATITGTLNVGGSYITAAQLRQGAMAAYNGAGGWSSAATSTGYITTGSQRINIFGNVVTANYFQAGSVSVDSGGLHIPSSASLWFYGYSYYPKSAQILTNMTFNYNTMTFTPSYGTIYYIGR